MRSVSTGERRLHLESLEQRNLLAVVPSGFTESVLASGLTSPTTLDIEESGRIWIAYQDGRIEVIEPGTSGTSLAYQLNADGSAEHGLQGLELDPHFHENHYLYVYYTANLPVPHNRLSRLTVDPTTENSILPGSELILLELPNLTDYGNPPYHIGGAIALDSEGHLFVQIGDSQQSALSQDLNSPLGKVLRINVDGTIPADNPYYNASDGLTWRDHVWSSGLRNPFAGELDPVTERYLVADVGQASWEEINDVTLPGLNFGWPTTEGFFNPNQFPDFSQPLYAYSHGQGCAITGIAFNNGGTLPFPNEYQGKVFFAEFCGGQIRFIDPNEPAAPNSAQVFATDAAFPMNIEFGPDGSLYYISRGIGAGGAPGIGTGSIRRITFSADVTPSIVTGPGDQLASIGYDAQFSVSAAGSTPLQYQWQVSTGGPFTDVPDAQSNRLTLTNVQISDSGKQYRVIVSNPIGSATSEPATLTVTSDVPPLPYVTLPAADATYRAGDTIVFSGGASDPEDGTLHAAQLTWRVDFHHNVHSHPTIPPTTGITGGSFTVPTVTETADDVWYRITLTATDSAGLSASTFLDVLPEKSHFVVETNLPGGGGTMTIDGQVVNGPYQAMGVENVQRTISVPQVQTINGQPAFFTQWLDGTTSRDRTISTPEEDTAYVALYRTFDDHPVYLSDLTPSSTPINGWGPYERDMSNGEKPPGDGRTISINGVEYAKGLGVHANSELTYNLGGTYSWFISDIGVDDEKTNPGSVIFRVLADGAEIFNSGLMVRGQAAQTVAVDVTNVDQLTLIVDGAGSITNDHADWAGARVLVADTTSVVKVNFQLSTAPQVPGYLPDWGSLFANRGNGWSYGWSSNHTDADRDRDVNPNQLLDTHVQIHAGQKWEIALPNGQYLVTASIGDAASATTQTLNVEGQNYWTAIALSANEFAQQSRVITVNDGRMTLDSGTAANNATRINYVEISQVHLHTSPYLAYPGGDTTLDSHLDLRDLEVFVQNWQTSTVGWNPAVQVNHGDFDFDGQVTLADWSYLHDAWQARYGASLDLNDLFSTLAGDYNRDLAVDSNDYLMWKSSFGSALDLSTSGYPLAADGNFDGIVNLADYTRWRDLLGTIPVMPSPSLLAAQPAGLSLEEFSPLVTTPAPISRSLHVEGFVRPSRAHHSDGLSPRGTSNEGSEAARQQAFALLAARTPDTLDTEVPLSRMPLALRDSDLYLVAQDRVLRSKWTDWEEIASSLCSLRLQ